MMKKYGVDPADNPEFVGTANSANPGALDIEKVFEAFSEVKKKAGDDPDEMKRLMLLRFGAGAVAASGTAGMSGSAAGSETDGRSTLLDQLKLMRDQGMMSEEQYEAQRKMLGS